LLFQKGSAELKAQATIFLEGISGLILGLDPHAIITFTGHTDCSPFSGPGGNLGLSLDRAKAVENWFSKHGFAVSKMTAVGSTQPIVPDLNAQGQCIGSAKNRTVVLTLDS
jgi:outer membrane protein OmpA-like peptidoglycan-associated protein